MNKINENGVFRKPAEFAPHTRTWMIWPHRGDLYGQRLAAMQVEFRAIATAIATFEPVHVVVHPDHLKSAHHALGDRVGLLALPVDDFWMRDCGPSMVTNPISGLAGVSWKFNAWGGKHSPWNQDAALAEKLLAHEKIPLRTSWLTCEGGALTVDGEGTLIVAETSILNPNRNPGVNKALAESELKAMLGVEKVVWLPGDPMDKETDGHIDGMCTFVAPGTVMFETNPNPDDPHARILAENLRCLLSQTDARGRRFKVLPLAEAVDAKVTSSIFCRSYINFYIVNGGVIVPGYGIASDATAAAAIAAAFPSRKVVQIPVNAIAAGGGAIHCITQEQPASVDHVK